MLYASLDLSRQRLDVLAELARRDLVPEIWLPDPSVRADRERARFRLHLVRHPTALKNRIHATLMSFGHPVPVADLFGVKGREIAGREARTCDRSQLLPSNRPVGPQSAGRSAAHGEVRLWSQRSRRMAQLAARTARP